jgi:acyl-CoA synthetase (AMP-forming)/AMP-acid ligase II
MRAIDYFDQGFALGPDRLCLEGEGVSLSYREVRDLTCQIAHGLTSLGIKTAAVLSPNHPLGYAAMLGIFRSEAVSIALNARSALKDNATHLGFGAAEVLFFHSELALQAKQLAAQVPSLKLLLQLDAPEFHAWISQFEKILPAASPENSQKIYRITMTGGTTGKPKGLPHKQLQGMVTTQAFLSVFRYPEAPRFLVASAMTHAAGQVGFHCLALGGSLHFMANPKPRVMLDRLATQKIHGTMVPPTLLYALLAEPEVRNVHLPSLRYLLVGAAPVSVEKIREAVGVFGPVLGQLYGQSESPMIAYLDPETVAKAVAEPEYEHRLLSCGRPLPMTLMAVMDDDGNLLPPHGKGEIVLRSYQTSEGYLDQAQANLELKKFGWHHTSDLGFMDDDGFFYIVDRKRDLIITGGFNVYPSEIEQVIWAHPAVEDCAVIGVPDDKWGEAVKAIVQLKPGAKLEVEALLALCREKLGGVKAPKSIEFWPELPRSAVGKVLKRKIRDRFWEQSGRRI